MKNNNYNVYLCGPTVYNDPHIGNLRPILSFDIYTRALRALGIDVNFVHNITDIDDKIIKRAIEQNTTESAISKKYEKEYIELLETYNVAKIEHMPRVTDNIELIIEFIQMMIDNKTAYISNGSVYLDVRSIKNYGKLSNRTLDKNQEVDSEWSEEKKNNDDFALWKNTKEGITFDTPWGSGRPGWHTECAAFIFKFFGSEGCDIHGGGSDLLFPHHENENAQFLAISGNDISKTWKHTGQLNLDGIKMSKSIGNVLSGKDFASKFEPDLLRYLFLTSGVTNPLNFTEDLLTNATNQLNKLKKANFKAYIEIKKNNLSWKDADISDGLNLIKEWKFAEFNKKLNLLVKNNNSKNISNDENILLQKISNVVGFNFSKEKLLEEQYAIFLKWDELRANKNYAEADEFRDQLLAYGII